MAEVVFSQVRKTFGDFTALHGLDLSIGEGEFVALLGPSGCGKTTTLRMLAGLEFPSSGQISIGERVVNDLAAGERDIAMVFQSYALYPHMTVAGNIAYPLKKKRFRKEEIKVKVAETAELLQLTDLLHRKPRELSGGQQQRVALGRALVRDPQVFLLDEPLSNLDAKLRGHMRTELVELHRRLGRTMVYVTHDQLEAMTMADRIAILEGGRLQQFAPPDEIYRAPANRFVASFMGAPPMNLIDGSVRQEGTGWRFEAPDIDLFVGPLGSEARPGEACLGIRPENVSIGEGPVGGEIQIVERTGHEDLVVVRVGKDTRLTARCSAPSRWRVGEAVRCAIDPGAAHVFAAGPSGVRLNLPTQQRAAALMEETA